MQSGVFDDRFSSWTLAGHVPRPDILNTVYCMSIRVMNTPIRAFNADGVSPAVTASYCYFVY